MIKLIDLKRDWLILAVCIITIVGCLYFYTQAQGKVDLAVKNCNDYWQKQISQKYSILPDMQIDNNLWNVNKTITKTYT